MPELPEIYNLAVQMNRELKGKAIADAEIVQEKCLNLSPDDFIALTAGKQWGDIRSRGKWIFIPLGRDTTLLLNLGMGGDVLYHEPGEQATGKYKLKFEFTDKSSLSINFWWFGYVHALKNQDLSTHKMTATLGISPVEAEFTIDHFRKLVKGKRGTIKSLLMDQKQIAGIGNVYVQDILFNARLHPNRKLAQLREQEIESLYKAICDGLHEAIANKGLKFEKDLYGNTGNIDSFIIGYKEGQKCPVCDTIIEKVKTGSTSSYICPQCQPVEIK